MTPSRLAISSARRAKVQFIRFATGAERSGVATLSAASAFTGAGPGATLALSAALPPLMKSLRHNRTVSSRTPKASAIRALVQPASVKNAFLFVIQSDVALSIAIIAEIDGKAAMLVITVAPETQ